jgi:hypothetical protein
VLAHRLPLAKQRAVMAREAAAGLVATVLSELVLTPLDAIKTLQQETPLQLGFAAAAQQLFARSGVLGMFSGGAEFIAFNALGGAIKFGVYQQALALLGTLVPPGGAAMLLGTYIAAALGFIGSSLIMVPGELLKMRLQIGRYSSLGHGLRSIYAAGGLRGFFAGYWVRNNRLLFGTVFSMLKSEYLPRQARDKYGNAATKTSVSVGGLPARHSLHDAGAWPLRDSAGMRAPSTREEGAQCLREGRAKNNANFEPLFLK